ncbi:unnamed protein product [Phytophthora lilii]|uniref:Unnamed protein product n=1 Tax=Phytophthora lilii TaxID=2077276 RepID=A0A9W7D9D0_9STRA|nr:unnamed protein product [Phytophthora lilii]
MLPQLQSLDGQAVTAAERLYAKLQLKTPLVGDAGRTESASPAPSPTRLLTPESLRREGEQEAATIKVDVKEEAEELTDDRWEDDAVFVQNRVDFSASDAVETQPSPLVLSSMTAPEPPERSESYRLARRQERQSDRARKDHAEKYFDQHFQETQRKFIRAKADNGTESSVQTREALLKSRVEALEAIIAVQDKTMKHALTRFGEQNADLQLSLSVKSANVPPVEAAAAVYTRLLAAWREKCVSLMVQARSSELSHEALVHEYRQRGDQIYDELARCEENLEMWRQRAADFEAQRDLEVVATRQAQDRRAQANAKAVHAVRGLALEREKLRHLSQSVAQFSGGLVRDKMEKLHTCSIRLEAFERRLLLAKERVELAATLVKHREVRVRNSAAAMEAERRVWAHRLEQMRNLTLQDEETKTENIGECTNTTAPAVTSGKILRPATETALRALFHRLDAYDTGLVRSQTLLQALRRGDPGVLSAVGGPKKLSKLVSHVETALQKLSIVGGATATLTWGEFLLFFIPESSVSLSEVLQDDSDAGSEAELERSGNPCILCAAVKANELPGLPLATGQADKTEGVAKSPRRRKERRAVERLSHAELVQQHLVLLDDRERLRRIVARDAHDLRDQVRGVRREWEAKTSELAHQKDMLQRELGERTEALRNTQKRCETVESAREEAVIQIESLRQQLSAQDQEFEQQKTKLETEHAARLQHEQEVWQAETQDARLAHSLLQADHSKQLVRIRQLERDLARQKEALLAHETERVASLEDKVRRRDLELARLRRERNTILSSLREQEQKLALASVPEDLTPTESTTTQTEEVERRTVASQTTPADPPAATSQRDEARGGRMSINEISAPTSVDKQHDDDDTDNLTDRPRDRHAGSPAPQLTSEDVNLRLQKLQSLTESLLAD